jgi:hypothetical protein
MYVATIVRDTAGAIHVRVATTPQTGGQVTVLESLIGNDKSELRERAYRFVKERYEKS